MKFGLLGRSLKHSYSPQIHSMLGPYSYELFEVEPEDLPQFMRSGTFSGLNVTIPYKKDVIPYCDELSETARILGAVNTIVRRPDGKLVGHNTDCFGFLSMVHRSGLQLSGKKVLVLGSGGASATVGAVLDKLGALPVVISRSGANNYTNLGLHCDAHAIVNTTPVGMYPNVSASPIDLNQFPQLAGVLDVIYNPARTALLFDAEKKGLVTENGLWMLVAQAKESAEWFTGTKISDAVIPQIHETLRQSMENTILIGMPGCGKSTIGQELAHRLNKEFVDADAKITELAGMSIPEIFASSGEEHFRRLETQALEELGKQSGLVIATGGGCVTREENYAHLHRNGTIVWLQRDIDKLPTDGRPLSKSGKLLEMYQIRRPMYERFADIIVDNNQDIEATLSKLIPSEEKI